MSSQFLATSIFERKLLTESRAHLLGKTGRLASPVVLLSLLPVAEIVSKFHHVWFCVHAGDTNRSLLMKASPHESSLHYSAFAFCLSVVLVDRGSDRHKSQHYCNVAQWTSQNLTGILE